MKKIAVIGAGAAGCFCAIEIKRRRPEFDVIIYEAGIKPLAKLAVTGGGKCNYTNTFRMVRSLKEVYPRGEKIMRGALKAFSQEDTVRWFEKEGISPVVQPDERVLPASMDAMHVVRTLLRLMRKLGIEVKTESRVEHILDIKADAIVVTTGGVTSRSLHSLTEGLGLEIVEPVPSLFTFNIPDRSLTSLMGSTVPDAVLSIPGTKFRARGILLVTDWGLSGPAALKLSSYAARHLADNGYEAPLLVNWTGLPEDEVRELLHMLVQASPQKMLSSVHPEEIPSRVWQHLLKRSGLREDMRCAELGSKGINRLCATLCTDSYDICGRCRFKDEFVTCGGVALSNVNPATLECRTRPGLYFAGEILDIDAVTGGFNLQAAWSTAMAVARALSESI